MTREESILTTICLTTALLIMGGGFFLPAIAGASDYAASLGRMAWVIGASLALAIALTDLADWAMSKRHRPARAR